MKDYISYLARRAKRENLQVRVFDLRYATQGMPQIKGNVVVFPDGSYEIIETGSLSETSHAYEILPYEKGIALGAIIHAELTKTIDRKKREP